MMNLLLFLHFSLKFVIFGGLRVPPKIKNTIFGRPLFSAARDRAVENKLFSATARQPPKVKPYFRQLFWRPSKISYFRWLVSGRRK
jgi:hypothetical protein